MKKIIVGVLSDEPTETLVQWEPSLMGCMNATINVNKKKKNEKKNKLFMKKHKRKK